MIQYDDGDNKVHDLNRAIWSSVGKEAKTMRAAKVMFQVSWVDNHGKRFPPSPQQLFASIDGSACSRLVVCSVRSGRLDFAENIQKMYLDPKGLLSASWAVASALQKTNLLDEYAAKPG